MFKSPCFASTVPNKSFAKTKLKTKVRQGLISYIDLLDCRPDGLLEHLRHGDVVVGLEVPAVLLLPAGRQAAAEGAGQQAGVKHPQNLCSLCCSWRRVVGREVPWVQGLGCN